MNTTSRISIVSLSKILVRKYTTVIQPKLYLRVLIFVEITTLAIVYLVRESPVLLLIAGAGLLMSSVALTGMILKNKSSKQNK